MNQIVCTEGICSGSPRIDGRRLTCANIVSDIKNNDITPRVYGYRTNLSEASVVNVLKYCANRVCITDQPANFCQGCSLDTRSEIAPVAFARDVDEACDLIREGELTEGQIYIGSKDDYEKFEKPSDLWVAAKDLLEAYKVD